MKRQIKTLVALAALAAGLMAGHQSQAQPKAVPFSEDISYFFPKGQWNYSIDPSIPTPKQHFGFEVGQQMAMYDQIVAYVNKLTQASPRFSIKEYGRTHENRPILCVAITSPANQARIEEIRLAHQQLADPGAKVDKNQPAVVEIMESIHGNEASGVNSGIAFAYFWAAARGGEIDKLLENTVILYVPAQNPDGCTRFATWVNTHRSLRNNSDPQSLEFHEPFPGGRSNHYWHDLNRDWINLTQPEMKAMVDIHQAWMPNIVNDHHEQSRDSFFFLEPADPVAYNPYIPQENKDLTAKVADFEASMLDGVGSLYFSKDSYDSYSLGTGDVYGDALGSVAMLFEQPSSRGHQQESANGVLNFQFTMRNQILSAFGAVKAASVMREELNDYMVRFCQARYAEAQKQAVKGWVFDGNGSKATAWHFIELMRHHGFKVSRLSKDMTQDGRSYKAEDSYVVSAAQKNSILLNSLFDTNKEFVDSLFYDVSTWNMAEAYGLRYSALKSVNGLQGEDATSIAFPQGGIEGGKSNVAYIFDNRELYTPYVVNMLQEKGIRVMVTRSGASMKGSDVQHGPGTFIVPVASQTVSADSIYNTLSQLAAEAGVKVQATGTSRMADFDLGHYTNRTLRQAKVAILAGGNSSSVGSVWFLLNNRMQMTPTLLDPSSSIDLSRYNVLVMTSGVRDQQLLDKIAAWVRGGGTLITLGSAYSSANAMKFTDIKTKQMERPDETKYVNFDERADRNSMYAIPGTDLLAQMDYSHPLCWGYSEPMPVFKNSTLVFENPKVANSAPVWFDKSEPLLSGYLRKAHKESIKGAPEVIVAGAGSGSVICFADDPNFRSVWYSGTRMFMNAILFGNMVR